MMWAAERGHIDVVRALITGGKFCDCVEPI